MISLACHCAILVVSCLLRAVAMWLLPLIQVFPVKTAAAVLLAAAVPVEFEAAVQIHFLLMLQFKLLRQSAPQTPRHARSILPLGYHLCARMSVFAYPILNWVHRPPKVSDDQFDTVASHPL